MSNRSSSEDTHTLRSQNFDRTSGSQPEIRQNEVAEEKFEGDPYQVVFEENDPANPQVRTSDLNLFRALSLLIELVQPEKMVSNHDWGCTGSQCVGLYLIRGSQYLYFT